MKIKSFYVLAIAVAMAFTSCRKGNEIKPALNAEENEAMTSTVMAASGVPQNSVFTIAGGPYTAGPTLVNGTGRNAHFNGPVGIQLMDDGTIYVADAHNNVIRKVTQAGLVSTFGIPKPGSTRFQNPSTSVSPKAERLISSPKTRARALAKGAFTNLMERS